MNKAKLKSYAPEARRDFIQMIRQRADLLGLTKKEIAPATLEGEISVIEGRAYKNKNYAALHKKLADKIRIEGAEQLIERVAYSWFNRFAALRFMEINNFLAHGFRVLSNTDAGKNEPEILTHAADVDLPGLDKEKVLEFKLEGSADAELYKLLLIAQCNELNRAMPFLFEKIGDETEILLPENLLATDSVIRKLVAAIDEEDWQQVEIIGWLYQFYISEKKDEVIGKTVKSEDIPAATQLFTPNWIVKYMTQNSLGRLWLESNPNSSLASEMEFYIKPAENSSISEISVISGKESVHETHEETRKDEDKNLVSFRAISGQNSSAETHEKNMKWIAEQLGAKSGETALETIRRYFSKDFFKDHVQNYKKRPIYWLFSSGKQKAFECLVYLHRYNDQTLARMHHEYVLPLMNKLTAQIEISDQQIENAETTSEANKLGKERETLQKKQTELAAFDEKLRHYSDMKISLDLDDGVKENYGKFGDLLAEVNKIAKTS